MGVVVIGSINMDYTFKVKRLPDKGETLPACEYFVSPGGKGANQATTVSRLGKEVFIIGALGNDDAGKNLKNRLSNDGVDTSGIQIINEATGNAVITVDESGSNTIVVYPGSNLKLSGQWIKKFRENIENAEILITQLQIPMEAVETAVKLAAECGTKVILNPAPAKEIPMDIYECIDIITPNETELFRITGKEDIEEGAKVLRDRGVNRVVVTLGEKGCYYLDENNEMYIESIKVNAIDTTAAGDAFNGALAVALCEGKEIEEALRFANKVGALTTTKIGAQDAIPYREEL